MGTPWNGLIRNKQPAPISARKIAKLNDEVEVRIELARRCGGTAVIKTRGIRLKDGMYILNTVRCIGGVCEICHQSAALNEILEPHEKNKRSNGGKVSLDNSVMCHRRCHPISKPRLEWIK